MVDTPSASTRLKALREKAGLSVQQMADGLGLIKSTYSSKEDKFKKQFYDPAFVRQVAKILEGRGIKPSVIWEQLAGVVPGDVHDDGAPFDPQPLPPPGPKDLPVLNVRINEVDVKGGMGGGGIAPTVNGIDEYGNRIQADDVKATWSLPSDYVRHELRVVPAHAYLIEVKGDSMSPTLASGDRVMIDTDDVDPGPGGVFALWDGMSVIVKRIERIYGSDPPAIRVISDNPQHTPFTLTTDDGSRIIGRVVWFGRRL